MFWLFAVVVAASAVFVVFCVPETQGKTLEDIEKLYVAIAGPNADLEAISRAVSYHKVSSIANLKATPSIIL